MALFCWNKWSPEWQFWQGSLPKIIPPDSTRFHRNDRILAESQGHDKDLQQMCSFLPQAGSSATNSLFYHRCILLLWTCSPAMACSSATSSPEAHSFCPVPNGVMPSNSPATLLHLLLHYPAHLSASFVITHHDSCTQTVR